MLRAIVLAVVVLGLFSTSTSWGQVVQHPDGQGYSIKIGNTTSHYRNGSLWKTDTDIGGTHFENYANGTQSTRTTIGNAQFYQNNLGTSGSSIQAGSIRFDNYSNPYTGQSTSGYSAPWGSSYQRTQFNPYFRPYRSPYGW